MILGRLDLPIGTPFVTLSPTCGSTTISTSFSFSWVKLVTPKRAVWLLSTTTHP